MEWWGAQERHFKQKEEATKRTIRQQVPSTRKEKKWTRREAWKRSKKQEKRERWKTEEWEATWIKEQALRMFKVMVTRSGPECALQLMNFPVISKKVYIYRDNMRDVVVPGENAPRVSWPILWALGTLHRKHILQPHCKPNLTALSQRLGMACNKIRWRAYFNSVSSSTPFFGLSSKHATTP